MASWASLSLEQRAAATHDTGPAAVYAGPGSGKTRVVTLRAARLAEQGARVLVTTFTNDATEEMRDRLTPLIPKKSTGKAHTTTLHALCLAILRGQARKFSLLSEERDRRALADAALAMELDGGAAQFLSRISYLKNTGETAAAYRPDTSSDDRDFARVWKAYEKQKTEKGFLEFDDLLTEVCALFTADEAARRTWVEKYTHIIVDECQDMNRPQYQIALALGRDHHNVMLVGDPDQSLYAFRGADSATFRAFAAHSATRVYELRENYRSTRSIITFADSLIRQDETRRVLEFLPTRAEGVPVRWLRFADADLEALAVGEEILRLHEQGAAYRDTAVLFRLNAQSEAFERHFAALGIPYLTRQGGDFYARKEVAGMLAYLEFFGSPDDRYADEWLLAFLNLPSRKLPRAVGAELRRVAEWKGKRIWDILDVFQAPDLKAHRALRQMGRELSHIDEWLTKQGTRLPNAGAAVKFIRNTLEFDNWLRMEELTDQDNDRIQNIQRMEEAASHYRTLADYLVAVRRVREENARRKAEQEKKRQQEDAVTLTTGHGAKGLEWRYVFACGWSEMLLPHRRSLELEQVAEERRIAYVMATRARDALMISSLQNWNQMTVEPSRFLTGLQVHTPAEAEPIPLPEPDHEERAEEAFGGLFIG